MERDKLIEEATGSLKIADFEKAAFLFDKISDLCIELGDDSLGKEFYEKSQKIKIMLEQVGAPQPTPAFQIETDRTEQTKASGKPKFAKEVIITKPKTPIETSEIPNPPAPKLPPPRSIKEQNMVMESEIENNDIGLKLNPEDFMVKIRPKTIATVPKDAKSKLKTSAFGHVKNIPSLKEEAIASQPKSKEPVSIKVSEEVSTVKSPSRPLDLFKKDTQSIPMQPPEIHEPLKSNEIPKNIIPETVSKDIIETEQPTSAIDKIQIDHAKKTLIELKLKKADLNKMALDFEMKELKGEITEEELKDKMKKI